MRKIISTILFAAALLAMTGSCLRANADNDSLREIRGLYPEYVTFIPVDKIDSALSCTPTEIVPVRYRVNQFTFDSNPRLDTIVSVLRNLQDDPLVNLAYVWVGGSASPDGPLTGNKKLGLYRAHSLADYLRRNTGLPSSYMKVVNLGEDWDNIRKLVENDPDLTNKSKVLEIIDSEKNIECRKRKIRNIDGGRTWRQLIDRIFINGRSAKMVIVCSREDIPQEIIGESMPVNAGDIEELVTTVIAQEEERQTVTEEEKPMLHAYLKTNLPAWLMLWTNIAAEIDCAPHWSVTVPVYYSGFNYFKRDLKWRVLAIQPEARYWIRPDNNGFFTGAHAGIAWYNYAFGGNYRYQDHKRSTPALGGGISVGYRFCVSKNRKWWMEASVGAGIYRMDYDVFLNKPNGLLVDRRKRTFYGIDNAAFSICYQFDMKGGKKK